MISYLIAAFNYLFSKECDEEDDTYKENFLAEQLVDLETNDYDESETTVGVTEAVPIPKSAVCFQRTGRITYMADNYILIDGMLYFETSYCSINLHVDDKILYLGYEDSNAAIVVVRILESYGTYWGEEEEEDVEESKFKVIQHVTVGEVDSRQERNVFIKNSDLKFNLDDVEAKFVPVKGDWIEMICTVQFDEDKPSNINCAQVLQVMSFKPLRSRIKKAVVTEWSGECGTCDRQIYFDKQSLQNGIEPHVGSKVMVEAIESSQGKCVWRVINMIFVENQSVVQNEPDSSDENAVSLKIEEEKKIEFTYPIKFYKVDFHKTAQIDICITNNSSQVHIINKWIVLSKKCDSQVNIKPFITQPRKLFPNETFNLTVTCYPKFLGNAKECLIVMFRGFQLKRFIQINVVNNLILANEDSQANKGLYLKSEHEKINMMKRVKNNRNSIVPGVRLVKPPAFVPVRLGSFPIPEKIWSVVMEDSGRTAFTSEFTKSVDKIEMNLPYLAQDLNIHNYTDRWHALVYMEEIQSNINIRVYDTQKAYLIRCHEYLALEIEGLAEKRPSLIQGDRVIVKDIWDVNSAQYEGFIHDIKGNLILMKFNPTFHERYSGSDVSIEFHFSRSMFRRSHQAINLAMANLGPEVLFPTRIVTRTPLVTQQQIESLIWFNDKLNTDQKAAVKNILKAEARPLPYCIFGPPGTGKTVTVIETILQILKTLPDSRILVATPSNSAANLITERLIENENGSCNSIVRLIAHYLVDNDSIPEAIKPFCATLDIATEGTSNPRYFVKNGIQMNCQTSFVGRQRVTIGTCCCLGTLSQMGLPKGHFTHLIVDEAGQATEPEIMIPMTFIDKEHGQIVLTGDPKQLGPVIISKYSLAFGMDQSYLCRVLETFPYQRDFVAFKNGFNPKLVTKLNDNYRSIEEVLTLPSDMFYDGSLVPKIDRNEPWITEILRVFSEMFECPASQKGGIYVYGIRGYNTRAEDSPSWYNPQEASMVACTTCKLYKQNINIDDIGIITPYIAQIKYLRLVFESMGLPQPKIGTVEEFQGQERPIILISTVRSTESLLVDDIKHSLGFVKSPKRLNVALTRAQVAVILFCNPHLLCMDPLWKRVIAQSVAEEKFVGCDLPPVLRENNKNVLEEYSASLKDINFFGSQPPTETKHTSNESYIIGQSCVI